MHDTDMLKSVFIVVYMKQQQQQRQEVKETIILTRAVVSAHDQK